MASNAESISMYTWPVGISCLHVISNWPADYQPIQHQIIYPMSRVYIGYGMKCMGQRFDTCGAFQRRIAM